MLKYEKTIIILIILLLLTTIFVFSENTSATDMSEDSFVVLDENGNPHVIEIETELDVNDIETFNDISDSSLDENENDHSILDDSENMKDNGMKSDVSLESQSYSRFSLTPKTIQPMASSGNIVRFKSVAELGGKTVTYTEMDTGREGYFNTNMANDAAYISTSSNGKVICKLAGVVIEVPSSCVKEIVPYTNGNISYYYVNDGNLLHYFSYINGSSVRMSSNRVGYKPSYLTSGKKYYSYDGHYFYSSFADMIADYKNYENNDHSRAINKNNPYYNYYQYLSLRSKTTFSASQLNNRISSSSSKMYQKGQTFVNYQNIYGINASLMFGIAINESSYGTSSIAKNKNNLFGLNAVDSSPSESANYFSSVDQCIEEFANYWMSKGYLNGNDSRYRGPHLGDKHSGINVKYASDPYWGEKAASQNYFIDGVKDDYDTYTIGISQDPKLALYKDSNTTTRIYTSEVNAIGTKANLYDYPVLILSQTTSSSIKWYKVQSDMPLKDDRSARNMSSKYNYDRDYVFAKASKIIVVNDTNIDSGTSSNGSSSTYLKGDVNGDGKVTSLDYIQVKNYIMGTKKLTGDALTRADVNEDGKVTSLDYIKIKNHIMGINLLF